MTVASETNRSGPYNGNGVTTVFSYGFRIVDQAHLRVVKTSALGVETVLTIATDYTVASVGDPAGGSITLLSPPAAGETVTILRSLPFVQETDLENQGAYYAETVEDALDLAAMRDQQLAEELARTIRVPAAIDDADLQLPAPEAGKIISWNETGTGLQNLSPSELSSVVAYGTANADIFTGNGVQTVFALSANPAALNNLDVSIGGVSQLPGTDYTWTSGTNLTFTSPPANGVKVLVRYMQALAQGATVDDLVSSDDGASGSLWSTIKGFITYLRSSAGSSIIGFLADAAGAVWRSIRSKARDFVSVKDFGAAGDGVTDDTAAFQLAFVYAISSAADIYVPAGTYIVQPLTLNSSSYSYMPSIFGSGRTSTVIKKKSGAGTGPVLTVGDASSAIMQAGMTIRSLTIDGLSTAASTHALRCYSFVRGLVADVKLSNAATVLKMEGGVSWRVTNSEILSGNFGIDCNNFSGVSNAQYPNACLVDNCIFAGHSTRGLRFNNGRGVKVVDCEFDTCGTSGNNNTSGMLIDANIDSEDAGSNPYGAIVERCWFEQVAGVASIVLRSGDNTLRDINFGPNPNSVYDIRVEGGSYTIDGAWWTGTLKSPAIYEDGGNIAGSHIMRCRQLGASNISINNAKTDVEFAGKRYTVATLPSPPGGLMRAWVSDSSVAASGNFGALLAGGGSNSVPAFFDGANWRIG